MAILRRSYNGRKEYPNLTYLHRPTRGRKSLVYQGKRFYKISESLSTDVEYRRALKQKAKGNLSVVWTGERVPEGRIYGTFVRVKQHKRQV